MISWRNKKKYLSSTHLIWSCVDQTTLLHGLIKCLLGALALTLAMPNKLWCHAYFQFSAYHITWSRLLIKIHIPNGKQCRSRSEAIWSGSTLFVKDREYLGSAGLGLMYINYPMLLLSWITMQIIIITQNIQITLSCALPYSPWVFRESGLS